MLVITYRARTVGSWDTGVKVGVEAGGPAHVSRESINVIGCEACGEAVLGHQLPESVALVNLAFAFLKDFNLRCVAFQYVAFVAAHESTAGTTAGFSYQKLLSNHMVLLRKNENYPH